MLIKLPCCCWTDNFVSTITAGIALLSALSCSAPDNTSPNCQDLQVPISGHQSFKADPAVIEVRLGLAIWF
jgi:hypothetical protein